MSRSLDTYSPEDHLTGMELERILMDEGLTTAMMKEDRALLVNAVKSTLRYETLTELVPESYAMAPEYNFNDYTLSVTEQRNVSHRDFPPA